jgi:hypothetical protein
MSDRITWGTCPSCGQLLAIGWVGDDPTEWDCVEGCELTASQVHAITDGRSVVPPLT